MVDSYTRKYGQNRPGCFGDVDEYDTDDKACQKCKFRVLCSHVVRKKVNEDGSRKSKGKVTTTKKGKVVKESERVETQVVTSFFHALVHNTLLVSVESIFRELVYAIASIPKILYPDPFDLEEWEDVEEDTE